MRCGRRVHQGGMASHEQHQRASQIDCEQRCEDNGNCAPNHQRMPLPLPDVAHHPDGMVAQVMKLLPRKRQAPRAKQMNARLNEWQEQQNMQRRNNVRTNLRSSLAETKEPRDENQQHRGDAYGGIDADHHSQSEAPCKTTWCDASAK